MKASSFLKKKIAALYLVQNRD